MLFVVALSTPYQASAEQRKKDAEAKKAAEEAKKKELAELFKPIQQQQKVPFGTVAYIFLALGTASYWGVSMNRCRPEDDCLCFLQIGILRKGQQV